MEKDWVVVFETDQPYRADIILQMLQGEGIEAVLMNKKDSSYVVLGEAEVLVSSGSSARALELIKNLEF